MLRCLFIISFLFCFATSVHAQQVKPVDANIEDILKVLEISKQKIYSFDISSLLNNTYNIEFFIKEYNVDTGVVTEIDRRKMGPNRKFVQDIPEEHREGFIPLDETGVYKKLDKLTFYMTPKNDSVTLLTVDLPGSQTSGALLNLKPLTEVGSRDFIYQDRPFLVEDFKAGQDIPLIMYGSFWYDSRIEMFRFCGETKINPNMTSNILQNLPAYYIIGVRFEPKQKQN